jgi:hemin uptake protein HemP
MAVQAATASRPSLLQWISDELFQGRNEIVIRHDGQDYRLRITRQNKLILTK